MNPGMWVDWLVQLGAEVPHTMFVLAAAAVLACAAALAEQVPLRDRFYCGLYTLLMAVGTSAGAAWLMYLVHG